jgi:hypothetical protein
MSIVFDAISSAYLSAGRAPTYRFNAASKPPLLAPPTETPTPIIETMIKLSNFFDAQLDEIHGLAERRGHLRIERAEAGE